MNIIISTAVCIALTAVVNKIGGNSEKRLPFKTIAKLFLGGFMSAVIILIVCMIFDDAKIGFISGFGISDTGIVYHFINDFLFIALVEEIFKYIVLRGYMKKQGSVKYAHCAVVAGAAVAAGFAASENIMYLFIDTSLVLRLLFGLTGHFVYAVFMGSELFKAAGAEDPAEKKKHELCALLIPFVMHGAYDFSCDLLQFDIDSILYLLMFLAMIIIYIRFYIIAAVKIVRETAKADISADDTVSDYYFGN